MRLLVIDPGRDKCGAAAMEDSVVLERAVVPASSLIPLVADWAERYRPDRILLGDRTGSNEIRRAISQALPSRPLTLIAETGTTLEARKRYFRDHPPRGWRRIIPVTLQVPPQPYDDYAAVVMGERYVISMKLSNTK